MTALSLFELNNLARQALALSLCDDYWVVAEIAELHEAANGHCYLELVEKEERPMRRNIMNAASAGTFKAKAKGNIWRATWTYLLPKFIQQTGERLRAGMKVLLLVHIDLHVVYGYSLTIKDIDPSYTLGDLARRRQEILQQLEDDGIIDDNKSLPLPRPLQRIAVISAAGAAGYGDFCNQLDESGFRFATKLFPATMQGSEVESTVIAALDSIAAEMDSWDCVVIIRGGGAVADLNGFETYLLAANVAQFPLPVLTGIGHERDETVIDLVAHTQLKTPTAVAQFLIDNLRAELDLVESLETRLLNGMEIRLSDLRQQFDRLAYRYDRAAKSFTAQQRQQLLRWATRLELAVNGQLQQHQHQLEHLPQRWTSALSQQLLKQQQHLNFIERTLKMAGPERILNMGYSITTDEDGHIIRDVSTISPGTIIKTQVASGTLTSKTL